MPDQSLQYESTEKAAQARSEPGDPTDLSGNTPSEAEQSAVEANTTQVSEGQKLQADTEINRDPNITDGEREGGPALTGAVGPDDSGSDSSGDDYDNEESWSYRDLQREAKARNLSGQGTHDELVARLREDDASNTGSGGGTTQLSGTADENSGAEMTSAEPSTDVPSGDVDPAAVENGGIARTSALTDHSSVLQGLSNDRKAQQLASVRERASRNSES